MQISAGCRFTVRPLHRRRLCARLTGALISAGPQFKPAPRDYVRNFPTRFQELADYRFARVLLTIPAPVECRQLAKKLLIADDSPDMRSRIVRAFESLSDHVEIVGPASDGQEALRLFEKHAPDAAVLDLSMPRLGGLDLLRAIRAHGSSCLIVILTIHAGRELRDQCLSAGADHFFDKSGGLDAAVEAVRSGLLGSA